MKKVYCNNCRYFVDYEPIYCKKDVFIKDDEKSLIIGSVVGKRKSIFLDLYKINKNNDCPYYENKNIFYRIFVRK